MDPDPEGPFVKVNARYAPYRTIIVSWATVTEYLPSLDDLQVWSDMGAVDMQQLTPLFQNPITIVALRHRMISRIVLIWLFQMIDIRAA